MNCLIFCVGVDIWCVKGIHPLETLHNALTLQNLESFLQKITENYFPTPLSSPSRGPTPISHYLNAQTSG